MCDRFYYFVDDEDNITYYSDVENETEDFFDIPEEPPKPTLKLVLKLKNPTNTDANSWVLSGSGQSASKAPSVIKVQQPTASKLKRRLVYPKDKPPPDAEEEKRKQRERSKHKKELAWLLESSGKYGSGSNNTENDDGKRTVRQRKTGATGQSTELVYENDDDDDKNKKRKKEKDEDEGYYANAGAVLRKHREMKEKQFQPPPTPVAPKPTFQPKPPPVDTTYSYLDSSSYPVYNPEPVGPALVPLAPVPLAPVQPEKKKKKLRDPHRPKRPVSAYIYFANDRRSLLVKQNPSLSFSEISKKLGEMWKTVDSESRQRFESLAHTDLERYNKEMATYVPSPEYQAALEDREYEVDKILGKRINSQGELEYLVRWRGYSDDSNSWEPISELWKCTELIEDFEWQEEQRIALANQPREPVAQTSEQDPELDNFLNEYSQFLDNIH